MRSNTKPLNSVALDVLQRKNQIVCRHYYDTVMGGRGNLIGTKACAGRRA
jgi:hypothetical protein